MNTKKQNSGSNAKFYVVLPTLEIMLSASKNCKLRAGYANMEYSNFMKHCKMQTDLRINTYTRVRDKKRLEKVGNLVKNSYLYR